MLRRAGKQQSECMNLCWSSYSRRRDTSLGVDTAEEGVAAGSHRGQNSTAAVTKKYVVPPPHTDLKKECSAATKSSSSPAVTATPQAPYEAHQSCQEGRVLRSW